MKFFVGDETEELKSTLNHETRADDEEKYNDEGSNEEIPLITDEEIQAAINNLKKGKASGNNGIRAEGIKTCDKVTRETVKQIFNEVFKQESCTPETWRRIRIKVIFKKKKGTKKMSETVARFALCQRCTNCFRLSCITHFIPGLNKFNPKIR